MKQLNGAELASFITQRQLHQARRLRQADNKQPCVAIVYTGSHAAILKYIALKQEYGQDIEVEVRVFHATDQSILETIDMLNRDTSVHGIVVQLPLEDETQTDTVVNAISPQKDVDGLGFKSLYDSATSTAINWLLAGYNIDLRNKKIAIVGEGRLVGAPLAKIWKDSGYDVTTFREGDDLTRLKHAEVIVTATGKPGLLHSAMIPVGCVVVDAGTADVEGKLSGDLDVGVYARDDLVVTPRYGGVGPLTIVALFDNVLKAADLV